MPRVVLDTNVLISALIRDGKPRKLLLKAYEDRYSLILSSKMLEEFFEVSRRKYLRQFLSEKDVVRFSRMLANVAQFVQMKSKFKVVLEDPDDDFVLRTAYDGKAEYVVTGDKHLLGLKQFRGIRIVSVNEMLALLK